MFLSLLLFLLKIKTNNDAMIFITKNEDDYTLYLGLNHEIKHGYHMCNLLQIHKDTKKRKKLILKNQLNYQPNENNTFSSFKNDGSLSKLIDDDFPREKDKKEMFTSSQEFFKINFTYDKHYSYFITIIYSKNLDIINNVWRSYQFSLKKDSLLLQLPLVERDDNFETMNMTIPKNSANYFCYISFSDTEEKMKLIKNKKLIKNDIVDKKVKLPRKLGINYGAENKSEASKNKDCTKEINENKDANILINEINENQDNNHTENKSSERKAKNLMEDRTKDLGANKEFNFTKNKSKEGKNTNASKDETSKDKNISISKTKKASQIKDNDDSMKDKTKETSETKYNNNIIEDITKEERGSQDITKEKCVKKDENAMEVGICAKKDKNTTEYKTKKASKNENKDKIESKLTTENPALNKEYNRDTNSNKNKDKTIEAEDKRAGRSGNINKDKNQPKQSLEIQKNKLNSCIGDQKITKNNESTEKNERTSNNKSINSGAPDSNENLEENETTQPCENKPLDQINELMNQQNQNKPKKNASTDNQPNKDSGMPFIMKCVLFGAFFGIIFLVAKNLYK
ncbi:putative SP-containing membrane protein [Vairimorpha necatrix]|uniref:SP-containing membrane protein n=1 Tax=Vairimorpha necatrix TaxID=6039 RepID=A0AAX4J9F6_9MICR